MRKKFFKYLVGIVVIVMVAYNSVYFKRLDEVKAERAGKTFNAAAYAKNFWDKKLMPGLGGAVELDTLLPLLASHPSVAFDRYSHALGIGNLRYILVHGSGKVAAVDADDITVSLAGLQGQTVKIATEYIFGNAARDATGLIDINDFVNTMDFNNVSAEINKIIRLRVLPLLKGVKVGEELAFTGAVELNKEHLNLASIEAIPVAVKVLP
ncbi:MAG TPA: DUF2291 domain-containing protein [Puia sp.]|nr:DUF2291 domain-containing protein [Puia sp.]